MGGGGMCPPQVLGYQLTLFGPSGADYARHITTGPFVFLDDAASLFYLVEKQKFVKKIQESLKHVMSLTYANNDK